MLVGFTTAAGANPSKIDETLGMVGKPLNPKPCCAQVTSRTTETEEKKCLFPNAPGCGDKCRNGASSEAAGRRIPVPDSNTEATLRRIRCAGRQAAIILTSQKVLRVTVSQMLSLTCFRSAGRRQL